LPEVIEIILESFPLVLIPMRETMGRAGAKFLTTIFEDD